MVYKIRERFLGVFVKSIFEILQIGLSTVYLAQRLHAHTLDFKQKKCTLADY